MVQARAVAGALRCLCGNSAIDQHPIRGGGGGGGEVEIFLLNFTGINQDILRSGGPLGSNVDSTLQFTLPAS